MTHLIDFNGHTPDWLTSDGPGAASRQSIQIGLLRSRQA